jgi:hypothetical protein
MVANFVTDIEISISQEVLRLIAEIDEFKGRWRALNALAPDQLLVRYEQGRSTWYGLA